MLSTTDVNTLLDGRGQVVDHEGHKIGNVGQVFLDDTTGEPAWVTVKTGFFGTAESFVPLDQSRLEGSDVVVPYGKDQVKDAPRVDDADGHLQPHEEDELYSYYGLTGTGRDTGLDTDRDTGLDTDRDAGFDSDRDAGLDAGRGTVPAGHDTSGPDTDSAMTRSEEQLHVGTTTETTGKARLRKFIVTENVTKTVPVSHEEVRIEREPITEANRGAAVSGGDLTEEEHEVELSAERVVVDKETVPVERVQLGTETVTEEKVVDEQVRSEQIEADTDGSANSATDRPDERR